MLDPIAQTVRIAAVGDLHYTRTSQGAALSVLSRVHEDADVLVLCGDLTDYGLAEEATLLSRDLQAAVRIPMVGVLGNHDYESGQEVEVARILREGGVTLLDGDTTEIKGVGFAGIKGFCGGFGRGVLGAWGEATVKQFVNEAVAETMKLESALARLRAPAKIAILHYAPVRDTVEGEPLEIYPYLGCSRLEEPLTRYPVTAVFHGHAHHGAPEGRTSNGIPVYNVSLSLMREGRADRPYRVLEVETAMEVLQ
ncbi:MAG: metallophosphoesterase [Acidobacteriota bacterium]|nr:metallophosphoesterase [Acidobacteriota bacterium]